MAAPPFSFLLLHFSDHVEKSSGIGSTVYNALPAHCRQHALYRKLTGEAMIWLKYGWKEEEVLSWMQQLLAPQIAVYHWPKADDSFTTMACRQLLPQQEPIETDDKTLFLKRRSRRLLREFRKGDLSMLDMLDDEDEDDVWEIKERKT